MKHNTYDISYEDFNPTVLFACKGKRLCNDSYHSHDFTEVGVILSGSGKYCIDGNYITIGAGDILFFNPGVKHQSIVTSSANPTVEFFAGFTDFHFKDMPPNSIRLKNERNIMHTDTELRQKITKLCYSMVAENDTCQAGRYFMMKAYLIQIILLILREEREPLKMQSSCNFSSLNKSYIVEQIMSYMDDHYDQKISLDQIAKNMYLSPVYISKLFKEQTGETPINYLIKTRLEKAKDILEVSKDSSIKNIANSVGYEDVYHFSKLFKKYYGVSPLHYKKDNLPDSIQ